MDPDPDPVPENPQDALLSSSSSIRVPALVRLAKDAHLHDSQHSLLLAHLLFLSIPRYVDKPSRAAALDLLETLVQSEEILDAVVSFLAEESSTKLTSSFTSRFSILCWICRLLRINSSAIRSKHKVLVQAWALVYDSFQQDASLLKSARAQSVFTLRNICEFIPEFISVLAKAVSSPTPWRNSSLIGLMVHVLLATNSTPAQEIQIQIKEQILSFFIDFVLSSKDSPSTATLALEPFFNTLVQQQDVQQVLVPNFEKNISKIPQSALSTLKAFCSVSNFDMSPILTEKTISAIMNLTRSVNAETRLECVSIYSALIKNVQEDEKVDKFSTEVSNLIRQGKTSSPEHRSTLTIMLKETPATQKITPRVFQIMLDTLVKELNETVITCLADTLSNHLLFLLSNNIELSSSQLSTIVKIMQDNRIPLRKASCKAVGSVLCQLKALSVEVNAVITNFLTSICPALDANIKNASTNILNSTAGPIEGYVAVYILLDILPHYGLSAEGNIKQNLTTFKSLDTVSPKPSFLVWSKVYRKLETLSDKEWFVRSAFALLSKNLPSIAKDESKSAAFGSIVIFSCIEESKPTHDIAISLLSKLNHADPKSLHKIMGSAFNTFLVSFGPTSSSPPILTRLRSTMIKLVSFNDSLSESNKESYLKNLFLVAHHPLLTYGGSSFWVKLLQHAKLDPLKIVQAYSDELIKNLVFFAESDSPGELVQAPYFALSALLIIAPDDVGPKAMKTVEYTLLSVDYAQIEQKECEIYETPEGVMYTDVLSQTSTPTPAQMKKKGGHMEAWDAEVRAGLAKKKAAEKPSLSKADQALVNAQLTKESEIRQKVSTLCRSLRNGLLFAKSIVQFIQVEQYRVDIVKMVLSKISLPILSLEKIKNYDTFRDIVNYSTFLADDLQQLLRITLLRVIDSPLVPQEFTVESLQELVTRALYRFRFQSEKDAFGPTSFYMLSPILFYVISREVRSDNSTEMESFLEQVALTLDIFKSHINQATIPEFPRLDLINGLLKILSRFPNYNKDAAVALSELGKFSVDTATTTEINTLLDGILCDDAHIRHACLQSLQPLDLTDTPFPSPLFLALHENTNSRNSSLAMDIWVENGQQVPKDFFSVFPQYFRHKTEFAREWSPVALLTAVKKYPDTNDEVFKNVMDLFREDAKELQPEYNNFGMIIESTLDRQDPWESRISEAKAILELAQVLDASSTEKIFNLLIDEAALCDRHANVRSKLIEVGIAFIELHGDKKLDTLSQKFEDQIAKPSTSEMDDRVYEAVVIFLGRLARHLKINDPHTKEILNRLIDALKTPSELVQQAVSECVSPLISRRDSSNRELLTTLLESLFNGNSYGERRGAAYGLLGLIKGHGISAFKDFSIIEQISEANNDKKNPDKRQGSLFAIEILYAGLGRIFEPFIIKLLPNLLSSLADTVIEVRNAAQHASKVMMGKLSGHAVKVVLPDLLYGLEDKQWRSKKGAVEMLGAMAYLAPRQLTYSLPQIIPRLTDVLTDTHFQVRGAANSSLKQFGDVINNPEIRDMQDVLLAALVDPSQKTLKALDKLLATVFAHYLDSSSLALIIPIVERGLKERTSEFKRKSSQIVGNMASLASADDFKPYLYQILPHVREVLVDPVPEARATAARSLGSLVERLGEESFPDLIPTLISNLQSESSGIDQQGSAQGLAEILAALGVERLEAFLPVVLQNTSSPKSYVREGFISLLIYLPTTFGERFQPYIAQIVDPILNGLADGSDFVRDASMKAGRMIIATHSGKAVELLLPELELCIFNESWRIRYSSVQLVGELLFRISGVTSKIDLEDTDAAIIDDDTEGTGNESYAKALLDALGNTKRDRILAKIFTIRQDSSATVRNHATLVWKALVQNTPRTARDIVPELMSIVVDLLSSGNDDLQEIAGRTLAELCRKLGERVLDKIFEVLELSMKGDVKIRQGVCLAICEILASTSKSNLEERQVAIVSLVRKGLVDDDPMVRAAAAKAFDTSQHFIGADTLNDTVPALLQELEKGGDIAESAAGALREIMQVRAQEVFPTLLPRLLVQPISESHANTLSIILPVSHGAISDHLTQLLNAMEGTINSFGGEETSQVSAVKNALDALLSTITASDGLHHLMMHLLGNVKSVEPYVRKSACEILSKFCNITQENFATFYVDWIRQLIALFEDRVEDVKVAAWNATDALFKKFTKADMEAVCVPLRRSIESTGVAGCFVDGFSRPNGIKPILPTLIQGILSGTAEQREQSALGIADISVKTAPDALKPSIPTITGPLIRVLGERLPPPVKAALLNALTALLRHVPQFLRPFFPQLQRTFVKNVSDSSSLQVRNRAIDGISILMGSQPRVDPVVTELMTSSNSGDNTNEVRDSFIRALAGVIDNGGKNITPPTKKAILDYLTEWLEQLGSQESLNAALGGVCAALTLQDYETTKSFLSVHVLGGKVAKPLFAAFTLREILERNADFLLSGELSSQTEKQMTILSSVDDATARVTRISRDLIKSHTA